MGSCRGLLPLGLLSIVHFGDWWGQSLIIGGLHTYWTLFSSPNGDVRAEHGWKLAKPVSWAAHSKFLSQALASVECFDSDFMINRTIRLVHMHIDLADWGRGKYKSELSVTITCWCDVVLVGHAFVLWKFFVLQPKIHWGSLFLPCVVYGKNECLHASMLIWYI